MTPDQRKAKIRWRSRRGMLELDLILERFNERCLDAMTTVEMDRYEAFLSSPDPDLYAWLMGYEYPDVQEFADVVTLIRSDHHPQSFD